MRANTRRRLALAGQGPIVDRARSALHQIATQFGTPEALGTQSASVRTRDGLHLELGYEPGNYVFSRVYNLRMSIDLPASSPLVAGTVLQHHHRLTSSYTHPASTAQNALQALNTAVGAHLKQVDLLSSRIEPGPDGHLKLELTPLGGSFVWVLIPPIFKATAFPSGEPARLLDLIRAVLSLSVDSPTPKGQES